MLQIESKNLASTIEKAAFDSLAYFDIFRHPLKIDEVLDYLSITSEEHAVSTALNTLVDNGEVKLNGEFYSIRKSNVDINIRLEGEARADAKMEDAHRYGQKIGGFPFVKGVLISGSMSKGVLHEDGDYDFFLIIQEKRVWISKLILKIYKVLFLGNSYEYFCINYLISDDKLQIPQQNIFTATELLTAIPVTGEAALYNALKEANAWVTDFLPNKSWREYSQHIAEKRGIMKVLQTILDNPIGGLIDRMVMSITIMRNKMKYRNLSDKSIFNVAFKSTRSEAKVHPNNTQKKVLDSHKEKISKFQCQSS